MLVVVILDPIYVAFFIIVLNVIMWRVIILSAVYGWSHYPECHVVMLSVVLLNDMAPV